MIGRIEQEGVAVRRGFRRGVAADDAAGAATVLDHDLLPERLAELRREQARDRVGAAARRVGHDDADRLGGPLRGHRQGDLQREEREYAGKKRRQADIHRLQQDDWMTG